MALCKVQGPPQLCALGQTLLPLCASVSPSVEKEKSSLPDLTNYGIDDGRELRQGLWQATWLQAPSPRFMDWVTWGEALN
jgi:hypothetical protein